MLLAKLVPASIRSSIYKNLKAALRQSRVNTEKAIPVINLQQKHINNLKAVVNREDLLNLLPKDGVVVELGVDHGKFSELILEIARPKKLHLVDAWGNPERFHDGLKVMVIEKFKNEIASSQVEVNVGYSTSIIPTFPANYFDWAYIDTDHSYSLTSRELNLLKDKMKPGGIIAGHDYAICNWVDDIRYGVIEAVHEFCVKENWEMIYLTVETGPYRSFAVRKLPD